MRTLCTGPHTPAQAQPTDEEIGGALLPLIVEITIYILCFKVTGRERVRVFAWMLLAKKHKLEFVRGSRMS